MMNIKRFIVLSILITLGFVYATNAQTKGSDLTWSEIKLSQEKERTLLETNQKDTLDKIVTRQNDELYRLRSSDTVSTQEITTLLSSHKDERLQIIKQFSEERTKLAQIHSEERKVYLQNQK